MSRTATTATRSDPTESETLAILAHRAGRWWAMRAAVSMAAKTRIGATNIEYWYWKDQRFGVDDQKRSRKDGTAIRASGERSGRKSQFPSRPIQTFALWRGVNRSSRLLIGWRRTWRAALAGPVPSCWYV